MRVLGAILIVLLPLLAIFIGGGVLFFINIPSIIIVFGGVIATLLFSHEKEHFRLFKKFLFSGFKPIDEKESIKLSSFLIAGSRYSLAWGFLGQVIGFVQMLGQIDDPNAIGPSMAVGMLTLLYGIFLSELIFIPLNNVLINKANLNEKLSTPSRTSLYICLASFALLNSKLFVVFLSFSTMGIE